MRFGADVRFGVYVEFGTYVRYRAVTFRMFVTYWPGMKFEIDFRFGPGVTFRTSKDPRKNWNMWGQTGTSGAKMEHAGPSGAKRMKTLL